MLALIQRVNWAQLRIEQQLHSEIAVGLLALVRMEKGDGRAQANKLLEKIIAYRVFADAEGKMNLGLKDVGGELMLVSQFTLAAATDKGLRPSFSSAMPPGEAEPLYDYLLEFARARLGSVSCGRFGADMQVSLENNGPVTFLLQS